VIKDLITLLNYQAVDSIDFEVCGGAQTPLLLPETEFRQVLLNLLQNAAQAIGDDGGTIVVEIKQDRQQLSIAIVDSGAGFSPEFLRQGIRPFFSLKQKGSGLGLVMVQRFARDQGGQLKLENDESGHGKVTLCLPLALT
jgi:C4-dicarboxylate-specific signal transduction histidine kinase